MDVDKIASLSLSRIRRMTGVNIKSMDLADLMAICPSETVSMMDKLEHAYECLKAEGGDVALLNEKTAYPKVVGAFFSFINKNGKRPAITSKSVLSENEVKTKYATLTPYLLSQLLPGKVRLIGFHSSEKKQNMWFSGIEESSDRFTCLGFSGERKIINFDVVEKASFSRIPGMNSQMASVCKSELSGSISHDDVKGVSIYLGRHVVPRVAHDEGAFLLQSFIARNALGNKPSVRKTQETPKI